MAPREELPFQVKRFIVEALACHDTPTTVVASVKETFGLEVSKQRVSCYNPTVKQGAALDEMLKKHFFETRERFLKDITAIPIANQAVRLRSLQRQLERYDTKMAGKMVADLVESAAKEIGGAFTNRRELSGPGGGPIETKDNAPPADKLKVLSELAGIFGAAAVPGAADAAAPAPAEQPPRSDPVVQPAADGGGGEKPGASAPGEAVAVEERPVLFADIDLSAKGPQS